MLPRLRVGLPVVAFVGGVGACGWLMGWCFLAYASGCLWLRLWVVLGLVVD
jgi:hypothetical protein